MFTKRNTMKADPIAHGAKPGDAAKPTAAEKKAAKPSLLAQAKYKTAKYTKVAQYSDDEANEPPKKKSKDA